MDFEWILFPFAYQSTWHTAGAYMFADWNPRASGKTERVQCQKGRPVPCRRNNKSSNYTTHSSRQRTLGMRNVDVTDLKLLTSDEVGSVHQHLLGSNPIFLLHLDCLVSMKNKSAMVSGGSRFDPGCLTETRLDTGKPLCCRKWPLCHSRSDVAISLLSFNQPH